VLKLKYKPIDNYTNRYKIPAKMAIFPANFKLGKRLFMQFKISLCLLAVTADRQISGWQRNSAQGARNFDRDLQLFAVRLVKK
jgi:hypothetical protein